MSDIEWKDGEVCRASGHNWLVRNGEYDGITEADLVTRHASMVFGSSVAVNCHDFQLNAPKQGDYIPKEELDTEGKYNDAVEVFGLFWFKSETSYESMIDYGGLLIDMNDSFCSSTRRCVDIKRKLTYNQLMAIGKLKRLMDERNNPEIPESSGDEWVDSSDTPTKSSVEYLNECIEVQKQRGEQYDSTCTGERSFAAAAQAYNAITGRDLKGSDICLILEMVKNVRQYSDPSRLHEDSVLDKVSYSSLWAEELNKELK